MNNWFYNWLTELAKSHPKWKTKIWEWQAKMLVGKPKNVEGKVLSKPTDIPPDPPEVFKQMFAHLDPVQSSKIQEQKPNMTREELAAWWDKQFENKGS